MLRYMSRLARKAVSRPTEGPVKEVNQMAYILI